MANRRMFSMDIVDSDPFLDMPVSTQNLYFHLGMRADDDGFLNNPRKIARMVGAADDDLKLLIAKRFLIQFQSGVVVIKHWKMNNYIRQDRYKPTPYQDELKLLSVKENGAYTESMQIGMDLPIEDGIPNVNHLETQSSLGQSSLGQDRLGKDSIDQSSSDGYTKSICDKLTEEDWDYLEQNYVDVKELIDLIDRRLGTNISSIRNPFSYILKVAKDERWMTK